MIINFFSHLWAVQVAWIQDPLLYIGLIPLSIAAYKSVPQTNVLEFKSWRLYFLLMFTAWLLGCYGFYKHW